MGSILAVTQADVVEASVNLYMLTLTSHGNKRETALMDGSLAFGVQAAPHLRIGLMQGNRAWAILFFSCR